MSLLRLVNISLCLAVVTSLLCSSASWAESKKTSDGQKAQAAAAFRKGQVLFKNGEYLEAAAAFERAYQLGPHPSVLANIGFCYDEAGDYPKAVSAFRKYMEQPNPKTPEDTAKISKYLKRMKSKVGDLVINCSAASCEVVVDGTPRGLTPANIILLGGPHSVTVAAVGNGPSKHYNVVVPSGGETVLDVDVAPVTAGPSSAESIESEKAPARLRAPFWVACSATFVGVSAITVLGVLNNRNWQSFEDGGSTDSRLKERGDKLNIGIDVSIGATAAAATTAIILAIIDLKRSKNRNKNSGRQTSSRPLGLSHITLGGSTLTVTF